MTVDGEIMNVSKHDRIKAFLEAGTLTPQEIAAKVGCLTDYVRAVRLRVAAGGATKADIMYREHIKSRYRTDPEFRTRTRIRKNAWARRNRDHVNAYAREYAARSKNSTTRAGNPQGDRAS